MNLDKCSINDDGNGDEFFKPDDILNELKCNKDKKELGIFRKLLSCPSKISKNSWEPVLLELLNVIVDANGYIDKKRLASQMFFKILMAFCSIEKQKNYIGKMLNLDSTKLCIFYEAVDIPEVETFKLIIIHGYLLASNETAILTDFFTLSFEIIHKYCMKYTKHIYFCFKLLEIWLKKSIDINFWFGNNLEIEKKLEAIIFSNWDNCINEIAKINALQLFPLYLQIMRDKYDGFLEYALTTTINHISWQNPTKFIIVAEIYKIVPDYPKIPHLELNIFQSLSKSHLRHVGTKLYITLMEKLDEKQWNELMREHVYSNAKKLESEDNASALHVLWELWMKPTLIKFKNKLVASLWVQFCTDGTMKSASYLAKISSELGMTWMQLNYQSRENTNDDHVAAMETYWSKCRITQVPTIIDVSEDYVKLNVFVAYCRMKDFLDENDNYELCKRFLYCNANSCSIQLRKGLFDNFKVLFERVMKIRGEVEISFVSWLYYFIFDCFEPGSCYQRKIIGLRLYETILMYTSGTMDYGRKREKKNLEDGVVLKEQMKKAKKWEMDSKFSLFILLKLCLDPIEEIRTLSFNIINNYFNINDLTVEEIDTLKLKANEMNRSSKFYEIAGGVKLTLIANKYTNRKSQTFLHEVLLGGAKKGLALIKKDILSALSNGSDFNASLAALLELEFQEALQHSPADFLKTLLNVMEDATTFFLSALSPKASDISYSSSFAEMGIAIEETIKTSAVIYEYDKNAISPAHQMVLSCIWLTLKTLCDLAAKISTMTNCHDEVKTSLDLIVSVLIKCRHKGAIEAAGVALGVSMRYLADKQQYHHLIDTYLDKILNLNSDDKIDLTRRGAGLSIMFHTMMSNDDKKTRRLLHIAVGRLMKSLRDPTIKSGVEIDSNQDCACARQLHFLRTIVADKTLHCHLVAYLEEISMICFEHLRSGEWAIRNGSLQLLGALIPRLVGQCSESEFDFGNGYSVDHFLTHYPVLADFILQKVNDPSAFDLDSTMMAILTLISKMSVGGCDFIDYSSQQYTIKLRNAMRSLFGHTVDHVRYAAAKAYAALISIREIPQELLHMKMERFEAKSRNFIHGHLMAQICLHFSAERAGLWLNTFPNNEHNMELLIKGGMIQLRHARFILDYCSNNINRFERPLCHVIAATYLQSFRMAQCWCKVNHKIFREVISSTQFFDIGDYTMGMSATNGLSQFVEQLFKLDPPLDWKYYFFKMYNKEAVLQSIFQYNRCSKLEDWRYYSLKYLRKHITEKYLQNNGSMDIYMKLFQFLYFYAKLPTSNHRNVVEICEIIILVLTYCMSSRGWFDFEDYGLPKESDWCQPDIVLEKIVNVYKNPQVHYLVLKIRLFIYNFLGMFIPINVHYDIERILENDDEQIRVWGVDILIQLRNNTFDGFTRDMHILGSNVAILSDESSEVRRALYTKMREDRWPNSFYYYYLQTTLPSICVDCRHNKYEDIKCLIPRNLELCLHYAIHKCVFEYFPVSFRQNLKWMPRIVQHSTMSDQNNLGNPFDQDETHREITKTFNIYFHLQERCPISEFPSLEPDNYNGIIMCSDHFLKNYITHSRGGKFTDLHAVLQLEVADYLKYKAECYEKKNMNPSDFRRPSCSSYSEERQEIKIDFRMSINEAGYW